jgi:NADPH-dependent 2,4-dienoyl-CoA reductase/sulfur reductase-like enzyme
MNIALRGMPPADQLHPFGYRQHRRSNRPIKHRPQFRQLVSQVHPLDWKNPVPASRYNLVVIGAGTAGLVSAAGAAGLGEKVALIERHMMGR